MARTKERETTETVATEHENQGQLTTQEHGGLPANSYEDRYAGEGTYTESEFTVTPQIKILHAQSPQVLRSNASYIENSKPGMIYLMSYEDPLLEGDEGIVFQPCHFYTMWEVRGARGSQGALYEGEHEQPQKGWKERKSPKGFTYYVTNDQGSEANQIHYQVGLLHIDGKCLPYAIRFGSTGIWVSKLWNGLISGRRTDSGNPAPRFLFTYLMRVRPRANQQGEWGMWNITPHGKATEEEMELGHNLRKAFEERRAKVAVDTAAEFTEPQGEEAPL